MKHRTLTGALAALATGAALVLGGCATTTPDPGTDEPFVEKLTVWAFDSKTPPKLEEGFAAAYPDYDLEIVQIPAGDIVQRLVVALQGGSGLPDVVQLPLREAGGLLRTGQFLDLTAELEPLADDFPEGILLGTDGKINTFTMGPGNMGLWINKAALDEHGLAVPDDPTWDDIVDLALELKAASNGTQYLFIQPPGSSGFLYYNAFFQSRGGNWWDDQGNLVADEDLAVDTLEYLLDLDEQGLVYHGVWTDATWWDAIRSHTIVGWGMNFGVGSSNLQQNVPEQSGEWQLVTWPKWGEDEPQLTGAYGGSLYAGLAAAANKQGAKDLIMWWLSDEGLKAQQDTLGLVAYDPAAEVLDLERTDPYFGDQTVIADLGSVPYPDFNYINWSQTTSALTVAVDKAYSGELTAAEAIRAALEELGGL